jgi:penicillin-binding protein 2
MRDKVGAVVAMEPRTGRILAMVSSPSFDSNALSSRMTQAEWRAVIDNPFNVLNNRAIQGQYPPASTYKPIHAAAALEEGIIAPWTKIFSGPSFWFAGRAYRDWKEEGHGHINVHKAIVQSSDTFFYQVGLMLGVDRLAEYSRKFGFGSKTGVPLQGEKSGLVPSSEWKKKAYKTRWYEGETISVSVGQGYMLATPLQLLNAYAAIANGGTLWKPILVDEITTPEGKVLHDQEPEKNGELGVSAKTMEHVRKGLAGVTHEDGGTARFLRTAGFKIAGKTGTAQVARLVKRTRDIESIPYKLRDHAWFAGFAPYDDPQIAVVVIVEHGGFGASAAAPVAGEVFKAYLGAPGELPAGLTAGSDAEDGTAASVAARTGVPR